MTLLCCTHPILVKLKQKPKSVRSKVVVQSSEDEDTFPGVIDVDLSEF